MRIRVPFLAFYVLITAQSVFAQAITNPPYFITSYYNFDTYSTLRGWYTSSFFMNDDCSLTGVQLAVPVLTVPSSRPLNTQITITVGNNIPQYVSLSPPNLSYLWGYPLISFYATCRPPSDTHSVQYALHFDAPETGLSLNFGCQAPVYDGTNWVIPNNYQQNVEYSTAGRKSITVTSYFCDAGTETTDIAAQSSVSFDVGTPPPTLSVGPTQLNLSTGDTARFVTTTADPTTASYAPGFTVGSPINPNSSCAASLTFSQNGGTGSVNTTVTASPPDCSRIFTDVRAQVGSTISTNSATIVVPPQIMIKMIVGEAAGQPGDTDQDSILVTARNRFGDSMFAGGTAATWQAVVIPSQFYGASNGTTNGPDRELQNASQVFTSAVGDIVGGSKCYWSPTNTQWGTIQIALQSGTKKFPSNTGAPGCWTTTTAQILYKASIGLNARGGNYSNAPAFVFLRHRSSNNDPAVVQIP